MKDKLFYSLLCAGLMMGSLVASVGERSGERAASEVEETSMIDYLKVQEERAQLAEDNKDEEKVNNGALFQTTHNGAYHTPYSVTGEIVELDDGSQWFVRYDHRFYTLNWETTDLVVIMPNTSWFSNYKYRLNNLNKGVIVEVNYFKAPFIDSAYYVLAIDYYNRQVCLSDGTYWDVSFWDHSILKNWYVGNTVMIGVNDGFFTRRISKCID